MLARADGDTHARRLELRVQHKNSMTQASPLSLHEHLLQTTLKEIFGDIDAELMQKVRPCMTTVQLPGGTVLIQQGDPSDSIYLVLSGRLRATLRDPEGQVVVLGEIGRGEPIGEMGVISQDPRGATVTALRDCVLLRLGADDFTDLLQTWPKIALPLARKLMERLSRSNQQRHVVRHVTNVCLLPLHGELDALSLGERLRATIASQLARAQAEDSEEGEPPIALITRQVVNQALGEGVADLEGGSAEAQHQLLAWLDEQEIRHSMQVLVADATDTAWTRLCLRHADHILLAAHADGAAHLSEVESRHLARETPSMAITQSLWLLHPDERRIPTHTMRWLSARPHIPLEGLSHFHTRLGNASDWARLARILGGQAAGLVFAGGGARGFSQLGIMQALQERGIEWDMAGGTSIGSVMAAYAAMDLDATEVTQRAARAFSVNPTGDVNWFPLMSIIKGRRLARVIHDAVVDALGSPIGIEDLWKPYFCVASNYSRAQAQVLRVGDLASSITASVSIPAALPPVLWHGDLLTDGGTFNNYPVDVMRASGAARVIGVDMSRDRYRPLTLQRMPSSFEMFVDRFFRPRRQRKYKGLPNLAAIVFNVAAMSSQSHEKRMREQVDLGFTPDVSRIGMLEWSAFDKVVEIGLQHARERLTDDSGVFQPGWFTSRHSVR